MRYRFSMGCPVSKSSSVRDTPSMKLSPRRCTPSSEATSNRAKTGASRSAPGAGTPAGDFWKRSGQHEPRRVPGHGAPSSKSSSMGHKPFNKAVPTRAATGTNRSVPGAGIPTGDFWKRSGQREPRRGPGHGARSCSEVVFCQIGMPERSRLSAGADIRTKLSSEEDYRV